MKIPFSINPLIMEVYERSQEVQDLISEQNILIDAQDLDFDDDEIPSLANLCVRKIAFYFDEHPWFYEVPCSDRDYLLELLSLDLDLELTVPLIKSEYYWERRYQKHFGEVIHPTPKIWTWKSLYLEREVQRLVETASPSMLGERKIEPELKLCAPYVKQLLVAQLQMWRPPFGTAPDDEPEIWPIDHIDFTYVLPHLPLVEQIDLVYGMNDVDFDFQWNMFRVSVRDCLQLGKAILALPALTLLRIRKSNIGDKQCKALMQSLVENVTIVELNMCNCCIGDEGAACIAKFLEVSPVLKVLNLSNNVIRVKGTEALAFALMQPTCAPLASLTLSLNPLRREGAVAIMRALVRCPLPEELYMSAVEFEGDVIERLAQMMTVNNSLRILDVSSNYFGDQGAKTIIEALERNSMIEWLDMRETGISEERQADITKLLRRNQGLPLDAADDAKDDLKIEGSDDGKTMDEDEDDI